MTRYSELFRLLRPSLPRALFASLLGIVAAAATVVVLADINRLLGEPDAVDGAAFGRFLVLVSVAVGGRLAADLLLAEVAQAVVARFRYALARQILSAPIDVLERTPSHRVVPVLTGDIDLVANLGVLVADLLITVTVAVGCLGWLAWLSPPLFGLVFGALVLGMLVQHWARARGIAGFDEARTATDRLHRGYSLIMDASKELRMDRRRRLGILAGDVDGPIGAIRASLVRAMRIYDIGQAGGTALFFALLAIVVGWSAFRPSAPGVVSGFVVGLLYLKGPLDLIIGILPAFGRGKVSLDRVIDLSRRFAAAEPGLLVDPRARSESGPAGPFEPTAADRFEPCAPAVIELSGVHYRFAPVDGREAFALGPIDLTLRQGELVFIVGDNGAGKTTLIKLLLGLYAPDRGEIRIDGVAVSAAGRDDYRQHFAAVLSEFHLFDTLDEGVTAAAARARLERLGLGPVVDIVDGRFSTTALSTGQRKRLALALAWLDRRPVMVFDEWAADQDPSFRHLFYTSLLPGLRAEGRTLVVISHDDRYFGVADRVIRLSGGRIDDGADESAIRSGPREPDASVGGAGDAAPATGSPAGLR